MANFRRYGDKLINRDYTANKRWLRESNEETQLSRYLDCVLYRSAIAITTIWAVSIIGFIMVKYL